MCKNNYDLKMIYSDSLQLIMMDFTSVSVCQNKAQSESRTQPLGKKVPVFFFFTVFQLCCLF